MNNIVMMESARWAVALIRTLRTSNCPDTELGPQFCNQETRSCEQGAVCCDLDDACSITTDSLCESVGGDILLGVLTCEPNPL